jgi:hypothetical protein
MLLMVCWLYAMMRNFTAVDSRYLYTQYAGLCPSHARVTVYAAALQLALRLT